MTCGDRHELRRLARATLEESTAQQAGTRIMACRRASGVRQALDSLHRNPGHASTRDRPNEPRVSCPVQAAAKEYPGNRSLCTCSARAASSSPGIPRNSFDEAMPQRTRLPPPKMSQPVAMRNLSNGLTRLSIVGQALRQTNDVDNPSPSQTTQRTAPTRYMKPIRAGKCTAALSVM